MHMLYHVPDIERAAAELHRVRRRGRETLVPAVEPVVAFIDSMRGLGECDLPGGVTWAPFLMRVRERVRAEVDRAGVFRIGNQVGVFTLPLSPDLVS